MADVTLTHPELKDVEITRDADVARVLAKAGWVPKSGAAAPTGTVEQIKAEVGDDPAKAAAALEAEVKGAGRTTLIAHLEAVVATGDTGTTPNNTTDSPDKGDTKEP